jgi:hypothetical protein
LHQAWLVRWAAAAGLLSVLVDSYAWCGSSARQSIISYFQSLPAEQRRKANDLVAHYNNPELAELAAALSDG